MQEKDPTGRPTGISGVQDVLVERYASPEMAYHFSEKRKHILWRRLWIALAEAQQELGLQVVSREQVSEMSQHVEDIDYEKNGHHFWNRDNYNNRYRNNHVYI